MKKKIAVCANGWSLEALADALKGFKAYAEKEVTNPTRIVTSTVKVVGGEKERVSCKTAQDIPKGKIAEVMADINAACVSAPVRIGDVLIENAAGTGVAVIATANAPSSQ